MEKKKELQDKIVFKFDLDAYFLYLLCEYISSFGLISSNRALNLAFETFYSEVYKLVTPSNYESMEHDILSMYGVTVYKRV